MINTQRLAEMLETAGSLPPGAERDRYLHDACADNPELLDQILSLLQSHDQAAGFLLEPLLPPSFGTPHEPGDIIGRYRILEHLGEGGCGIVYVAEQSEPVRRRVALKVIKFGMDTRQVIARFEAERQALAIMDHPNIARVFDAGSTKAGRPFFVMELVRGLRITEFCNENQLSTRERLDLFIKVCQAIQHAHQKGIIHRDIKPSNILVTLHDSVPVPKVIDFGIAKAIESKLTDATVYTHLLQFVGTPAYMSPEQAEMSGLDPDTRSDIYSLGVLLYELLTGQTPFDGKRLISSGLDEMRRTIREKEPQRPSIRLAQEQFLKTAELAKRTAPAGEKSPLGNSLNTGFRRKVSLIRGDLDCIVMKCLEKDRSRRYETAAALVADLQRHLAHEPVEARPASRAYKFQKAWRKNKLVFNAAAAVGLTLVAGITVSTWLASAARTARRDAEHEKITAKHDAYVARMFSAGPSWEEGNFGMVRQLLLDTAAFPERGFEWYYWQRQTHLHLVALRGHSGMIKSIAFFPEGYRLVTGSTDYSARVWNGATGEEIRKLEHTSPVNGVAVSGDGKRIATASRDDGIKIWDAISGRELSTLKGARGGLNAIAFSPDGQHVLGGGDDGLGGIWRLDAPNRFITLRGYTNKINSVAYSPAGDMVVTIGNEAAAHVWSSVDGKELFPLIGHQREIRTVTFTADGRKIMTGGLDQSVRFWDVKTGAELLPRIEAKEPVDALASSPDGQWLATASRNSIARLYNGTNSQRELTMQGHVRGLQSIAISSDGTRIATGGFDRKVTIWDAQRGREELRITGNPTNSVLAVAISPDGTRIATGSGTFRNEGFTSGSGEHAVQVWDANKRVRLLTISDHDAGVSSIAFSPDGTQILSGSGDQTAKLWDSASGSLISTFKGHLKSVSSVAFFPTGDRILTGSQDGTARVWNALTGDFFVLTGHTAPVTCVAVSPDGHWVATGSMDATTRIWEAASRRLVRIIDAHIDGVNRICALAFSPDSRLLAMGTWDPPTVWEVADTNRPPVTLEGQSSPTSSIVFSPDGSRIVTGGLNGIAKVWEAASGRELLTLRGHTKFLYAVAIATDGNRILTGSADQTVRIWEAARTNQVAVWAEEEREKRAPGTFQPLR